MDQIRFFKNVYTKRPKKLQTIYNQMPEMFFNGCVVTAVV